MLNETQLNSLYQYAMALCQQPADAYDLLQSALEKYLIEVKCRAPSPSQPQSQPIDKPEAFMRTLIRNRFIDQHRLRKQLKQDRDQGPQTKEPAS